VSEPTLFDATPYIVTKPEPAQPESKASAGTRLRLRQAQAIANGVHPLALVFGTMRMHPDANRHAKSTDYGRTLPLRCGSCRWREPVNGGAHAYPKCMYGKMSGRPWPRVSHGPATDVRAWWPACTEYAAVSHG